MKKFKNFLVVLTVIFMFSQSFYVQAADVKDNRTKAADILKKANIEMQKLNSCTCDIKMDIKMMYAQINVFMNYDILFTFNKKDNYLHFLQYIDGTIGEKESAKIPIEYIQKGNLAYINLANKWTKIDNDNDDTQNDITTLTSENYAINQEMFNNSDVSITERNNQWILKGKVDTNDLPQQFKQEEYISEDLADVEVIVDKNTFFIDQIKIDMDIAVDEGTKGKSNFNMIATYKEYNEPTEYKIPEELKVYFENPQSEYLITAEEYYNDQNYEEAIKAFNQYIEENPKDKDVLNKLEQCYYYTEQYEEAVNLCDDIINISSNNLEAYINKINALYMSDEYEEAIKVADTAILVDNKNEGAYVAKANILYELGRYNDCLETAIKGLKKIPHSTDLMFFKVNGLSRQNKYEEAIQTCNKILDINKDDIDALNWRAYLYYYQQKYTLARIDANHILRLDKEHQNALELKEDLKEAMLPTAEKVKNFVEQNYLYIEDVKDFEAKSKVFTGMKEVTPEDIEQYIDSVKLNDDIFTFVLYGEDYTNSVDEDNTCQISHKKLSDTEEYIKIKSFGPNTGYNVKEIIKNIKSPENKTLVIDLRDNMGGYIDSANEVLDALLPECCPSMYIDRQGYTYEYYSDSDSVKFKNIVVMTNESTASSAELLTLSLKEYLKNVTILGKQTFGKGVGQTIFEDMNNNFAIYLVNNHWNVKEQNIMYSGILPDIKIDSPEDKDYFDALENIK